MAENASSFEKGCRNCKAVLYDGDWTLSHSIVSNAPRSLKRESLCCDCSCSCATTFGGYSRQTALGNLLGT